MHTFMPEEAIPADVVDNWSSVGGTEGSIATIG